MLWLKLVTTPEDRKEKDLESEAISCTARLILVSLSLRGLALVVLLQRTLLLQRRGGIVSVRLRHEICWRCEDSDKAFPEGISSAADAPELR
jgi:hypothetical protein